MLFLFLHGDSPTAKEVLTILTDEQFQKIKKMLLNKRIGKNRQKRLG